MTRGQIFLAFLSLLLLVTAATIGRQPEDEVPTTPPPDRSTEIPTTTARSLFLDGMRYQLAQAHERAGDIAAAMRLYDDALLRRCAFTTTSRGTISTLSNSPSSATTHPENCKAAIVPPNVPEIHAGPLRGGARSGPYDALRL
jgi:hypothetical protein